MVIEQDGAFEAWKRRKDSIDRAKRYLKRLRKERALNRNEWHDIGRALYAVDASGLLSAWSAWSKSHQSPFQPHIGHIWSSFRPRTTADRLTDRDLTIPMRRFGLRLDFLDRWVYREVAWVASDLVLQRK